MTRFCDGRWGDTVGSRTCFEDVKRWKTRLARGEKKILQFGMPRAFQDLRWLLPGSGRGKVFQMSGDFVMTKKRAWIVCGLTVLGLMAGPWGAFVQAHEHHGHPRQNSHYGHQRHLPTPPRPVYATGFRPAPAYYAPPVAGARIRLGSPRFSIGIGFPLVVPAPQYYGPVDYDWMDDGCYRPNAGW